MSWEKPLLWVQCGGGSSVSFYPGCINQLQNCSDHSPVTHAYTSFAGFVRLRKSVTFSF